MELLVVVAMVALLASLLLSALSRAKNSGARAVCKSNLRQIDLALALYVSDTGLFPSGVEFRSEMPLNRFWAMSLQPYSAERTNALYHCPSYKGGTLDRSAITDGYAIPFGSYGYNAQGTGPPGAGVEDMGLGLGPPVVDVPPNFVASMPLRSGKVKEAQVVAPGEMLALGDSFQNVQLNLGFYWISPFLARFGFGYTNLTTAHLKGHNVAFCDGHLEYVPSQTLTAATDSRRRLWNNDNQPHRETW